jgi:hypothetical protein
MYVAVMMRRRLLIAQLEGTKSERMTPLMHANPLFTHIDASVKI